MNEAQEKRIKEIANRLMKLYQDALFGGYDYDAEREEMVELITELNLLTKGKL